MNRREYLCGGSATINAKRGLDLPWTKLNETIVRRIRIEHAEKERMKRELDEKYSCAALAKRYGVSVGAIEKVISMATWRHVR